MPWILSTYIAHILACISSECLIPTNHVSEFICISDGQQQPDLCNCAECHNVHREQRRPGDDSGVRIRFQHKPQTEGGKAALFPQKVSS